MTRHDNLRNQAEQANNEAIKGGIDGGIRWFLGGIIVFGTAQLVWPVYRGLTIPFKAFLLSSVTATGAVINAEKRLNEYEKQIRGAHRLRKQGLYYATPPGEGSLRRD